MSDVHSPGLFLFKVVFKFGFFIFTMSFRISPLVYEKSVKSSVGIALDL